jgi:hypothetical protein
VARRDAAGVRLLTRKGNNFSRRFPQNRRGSDRATGALANTPPRVNKSSIEFPMPKQCNRKSKVPLSLFLVQSNCSLRNL